MKIEILRENLERAISLTSKVSNKNLSLPVLGCVVFVVDGAKAVVRATNLDVSMEATLKAKVFTPGVVAVPAQILAQTVAVLTDQKLTLELKGTTLGILGERGTTSITTVDASEFPTLPYVKEGQGSSATVGAKEFVSVLRSVAFAASTSSVKPELAAVSLTLERGELVAAATDSFRLAEVKIPIKTKTGFGGILIPARNVADIMRAVESSEMVEIRVGENQCTCVADFGFITARTIDGAFPDYRAIIPKEFVAEATCLTEDAARAFKKIAIFTDAYNQVHLSVKPSDKSFTVSAVNAAVGETVDRVPGALEGEDVDMNFNARYIMDALSILSADSVKFSVAGEGKPMLLTDVPHKGFTYLVMPMNR